MPILVTGKNYPVLPVGNYPAVCYEVWDIGYQKGVYKGIPQAPHKIIIAWEVSELMETEDKYNGKRYVVSNFYSLSLGKKANLRRDLIAWRGKEFSAEEIKSFDIEKLIGANCLLNVIHNEKGKATVSSISPLMKGMEKMLPENKRSVPAWVQKFIDNQITLEQAQEIWAMAEEMRREQDDSGQVEDSPNEVSEVPF